MSAHLEFYSKIETNDYIKALLSLCREFSLMRCISMRRLLVVDHLSGVRKVVATDLLYKMVQQNALHELGLALRAALATMNPMTSSLTLEYVVERKNGGNDGYAVLEEAKIGKIFMNVRETLFLDDVNFRLLSGNANNYLRGKLEVIERNIDHWVEDVALAAKGVGIDFGFGSYNDYPRTVHDVCLIAYTDISKMHSFLGLHKCCDPEDIEDIVSMTDYMKYKRFDQYSIMYAAGMRTGQFERLKADIEAWL